MGKEVQEGNTMSVKLSAFVWDGCAAAGMKITSVVIMARLADFSSDEGLCWPSIATIARQIGAGPSTVRTALRKLESEGWITTTARRNGNRNNSNMYQLNVKKLREASALHQPESDASDSDTSKSDASKSGASVSDPSTSDAPESGKKASFDPPESGGDPSVNSTNDPTDKKPPCRDASQPDEESDSESDDESKFLAAHPEAAVFSLKNRQWGSAEDLRCAKWIWTRITVMYEKAAEHDGEIARPKDPSWADWSNEIRLMRSRDGRSHRQICTMFDRVQRDSFWVRNILSPSKLREKWDELAIKLSPATGQRNITDIPSADYPHPEGFRGA
jgi:DNA-binding transcriptional regulator YhcF (GntR family)